jgi:Ca2+/H+ antiporter
MSPKRPRAAGHDGGTPAHHDRRCDGCPGWAGATPAVAAFFARAAVSLAATSWLLVSRLERVGERLGLPEALLGTAAALAAAAPEISAAASALVALRRHPPVLSDP